MIGENDEDSEELYDAEMKPIIEDRLKNGKRIRVTLDELMTDQIDDENLKKEAWAKLNQMLKEAQESGISNRTIEEIFDSVYREKGLSQEEINELRSKHS